MARLCVNGSTWMKVKNSLVGKELISLAVEGVRFAEETDYMLFDAFDYRTASKDQLISMSHTYDIPVTFYKPSTVVVRTSDTGRLIRAFDLCLKIGSVTYYNIAPAVSGSEITLYQGTVFKKYPVPAIDTIYTKTSDTINGYTIGNVVPESIYVYDTNNGVVSRYNHLIASSLRAMFKIYTKENGDQMILIGNGVWAQAAVFGSVDYLQPSCTQVSFENASLALGGVDETDWKILSSTEGKAEDIDYARLQFEKYYLNRNAVVSKDQIHNYVNSFPEVQDCNVARVSNVTHVYVKPADQTSTEMTFDRVKAELLLHSELSANYAVDYGKRVDIQFIVYGVQQDNQGTVSDYIAAEYAYADLEFSDLLNLSALENEIYRLTGDHAVIRVLVKGDDLENGYLISAPDRGTIGIYDGESYIGYDFGGVLYRPRRASTTQAMNPKGYTLGSVYLQGIGTASDNIGYYDRGINLFLTETVNRDTYASAMTVGDYAYAAKTTLRGAQIDEFYSADLGMSTVMQGSLKSSRSFSIDTDGVFTLGDSLVFSDEAGLKVLYSRGSMAGSIAFYNTTGLYYTASINGSLQFKSIAKKNTQYYVLTSDNSIVMLRNLNTSVESFPIYGYQLPPAFFDWGLSYICNTSDGDLMAVLYKASSEEYAVITFTGFSVDSTTNKLKMVNTSTPHYVTIHGATVEISNGDRFIDIFSTRHDAHYRFYAYEDYIDLTTMPGCTSAERSQIGTVAYSQRYIRLDNTSNYSYNYETTAITDLGNSKYVVVDEDEPVIFR